MSVNPTSSSPRLVVTSGLSLWRTEELRDTDALYQQLVDVQKEHQDEVVVSGSFFQETRDAKRGGILKRAARIAIPALTATGLLVAGTVALPLTILGGIAGLVTAVIAKAEGPQLMKDIGDYRLAGQFKEFEALNVWREGGPSTQVNVEKTSPPQDGLRELLISNMRDYPNSMHVVHANGHGKGSLYSAGLPAAELANALTSATAKSQNEVDVFVLDTCFGANFESLARINQQPGAVKYVVAFEDAIPNANSEGGRLPVKEMLSDAVDDAGARDAAVSMAKVAGEFFDRPNNHEISQVPLLERLGPKTLEQRRKGLDSTVAAIDMEAFGSKLHPALDRAGSQLQQALSEPTLAAAIAEAKSASEIDPSRNLIDLGNFLSGILEKAPEGSPLQTSLKEALAALDATLMFKRTGKTFPLSGLSVHTKEAAGQSLEISATPTRPLDGDHLPQGWVEFIKQAF